jgi:hypothetical protein
MFNKLAFLLVFPVCVSYAVNRDVIKPDVSPPASLEQIVPDPIFDDIISKQANFNTLYIRAKAKLEIDDEENNVNMTIRIEKDKAIWISVTAVAGLEIARALITPDSLKILNRVENTYTRKPFNYVYEFTNKQLNFNSLQSIFVGNAMPEFLNEQSVVTVSDKSTVLSGALGSLIYALTVNEKMRITESNLKDDDAKQSLQVVYKDFTFVSGQIIPQSVNVKSSTADKNIFIDLKYSRVNVNVSVDLPFNVPQRFKVIN